MAKTIPEYYDMIVAVKEGRSELDGLTPLNETSQNFLNDNASGSRLALWRLWCWIMATVSWVVDVLFDKHREEVEALLNARIYGTLMFYHQISLDFQYGDPLIWNGRQYAYEDTTSPQAAQKRIIKRAAVVVSGNQLQFKVAGLDPLGNPVKLSNGEKSAFEGYLNDLAYAGTNIVVISEDADRLRLELTIFFDALVLSPDGSSIADPSFFPVEDAIGAFIKNLPFNGRMNLQKLIDAMQAAQGVKDLELHTIEARYGNLPFTPVGREYIPFAGHMTLDMQNSRITYQRYV